MCSGDLLIDVYEGHHRGARISLLHGESIRWDSWSSDALLRDGRRAVEWLAEHGVVKPLNDYEAEARRRQAAGEARRRWQLAMPPCLQEFLPGVMDDLFAFGAAREQLESMDQALQIAFGSEEPVLITLLGWFGQEKGPWSGFPAYEEMAEKLILRHSTAAIMRSLEVGDLTTAQLEGASRLFSAFTFQKERPGDINSIPYHVRVQLESHMASAEIADNRERFSRAFGM